MIWPPTSRAPKPNPDLPPHVTKVYEEARSILELSPSGAAALLRKALEMLCVYLGARSGNLWDKIETVAADYPERARKAAHTIRLFGNDQLHVDAVKLSSVDFFIVHEDDDVPTAERIFELLNFIADDSITIDKKIDALYNHEKTKDEARKAAKNAGAKVPGNAREGMGP